jgi:site-specific DNA recombinase
VPPLAPFHQVEDSTPLIAGIYGRISDDREGRELGVTRQLDDGHALAERIRATVADTYIDNDISASTRSHKVRPEFDRLLADIRAGRINAIIYYSTSRLTRRPLENELIIQLVEQYGVRLFTVTMGEVDLTTSNGRMLARMLAAKDANEAEETAERVLRAQRQMREMGRPTGGPPLRGYLTPDPTKGIGYLTHVDVEAQPYMNGALERIVYGSTVTTVIKWWNADGFLTGRGGLWAISTAVRLLTNPRIAGLVALYDTNTKRHRIIGEGNWPAVVERDLWEAVFVKLTAKRRAPEDLARKYIGSGYVRCGLCGALHRMDTSTENGKRRQRYTCNPSRGGCGGTSRDRQWIEAVIREYVAEQIRIEAATPQASPGAALTGLQDQVAALDTRLAKVRDSVSQGLVDILDASPIMNNLREQIERLNRQQANVTIEAKLASVSHHDVLARWLSEDPDDLGERRMILGRHVKAVHVHPLPKGRWSRETIPLDSITIEPV